MMEGVRSVGGGGVGGERISTCLLSVDILCSCEWNVVLLMSDSVHDIISCLYFVWRYNHGSSPKVTRQKQIRFCNLWIQNFPRFTFVTTMLPTFKFAMPERRCRIVGTRALYSGGPGFES